MARDKAIPPGVHLSSGIKETKGTLLLDEAAFEQLEEKLETMVQEAVTFAEESPWPDVSEMYKDVYIQSDYPYITD